MLLAELARYKPELLERPRLVVGSKADRPDAAAYSGTTISAVTGDGLPRLVGRTMDLVRAARSAEPVASEPVVHRPVPEGVAVERTGQGFVVRGRPAERAVAVNDLTNPHALEYVQGRLRRLGVDRALARAGAREGDLVTVGGFTFEYQPDQ